MLDEKSEMLDIAKLKPYKNNSRIHSPDQIKKLAKSIEEFGFTRPILIWGNDQVVAGHGVLEASKLLGLKDVPVRRLDHLNEKQMKAYVIADNKLASESSFDQSLLLQELTELADLDFDIGLTGFDMDFLGTAIIEAADFSGSVDGDREDHEIIGSDDRNMNRKAEGSIEYEANEFDNLKHACPKCGFEFDKGMQVIKEESVIDEDGTMEAQ